jgi:hypothetical protein
MVDAPDLVAVLEAQRSVADDADDRGPFRLLGLEAHLDTASDRIPPSAPAVDELLVHQGDHRCVPGIGRPEHPAAEQRDAHRGEIASR